MFKALFKDPDPVSVKRMLGEIQEISVSNGGLDLKTLVDALPCINFGLPDHYTMVNVVLWIACFFMARTPDTCTHGSGVPDMSGLELVAKISDCAKTSETWWPVQEDGIKYVAHRYQFVSQNQECYNVTSFYDQRNQLVKAVVNNVVTTELFGFVSALLITPPLAIP